ncbi:MAG: Bug family tripartite tricarboxylate transporter substrate binding protein [Betaproteobacteria bacterium]
MNLGNLTSALGFVVLVAPAFGHAAEYPVRPIRVTVPFPPGGTSDILTRIIGEKLTAGLGQQIVVDNRPGAGGVIATDIVAKAAPDGHTLYMTFVSHAINPYVYAKLPYDTRRDFTPVALFAVSPNVLVVTPSLPVKSIKDLIALARSKPGKVNYGSAGVGTNSHLSAEMIIAATGVKMTHIPYKGAPQANADVAAGLVQVHIPSMPVTMPLIQAGRLRAIAVTSSKRSPVLPDVPTVAETLPGYESLAWYGFIGPRGTPPAVVARLNQEIEKALRQPDLIDAMSRQGAEPTYRNAKAFGDYIEAELARWGAAVKAAGLKPGNL